MSTFKAATACRAADSSISCSVYPTTILRCFRFPSGPGSRHPNSQTAGPFRRSARIMLPYCICPPFVQWIGRCSVQHNRRHRVCLEKPSESGYFRKGNQLTALLRRYVLATKHAHLQHCSIQAVGRSGRSIYCSRFLRERKVMLEKLQAAKYPIEKVVIQVG